MKAACKEVFGLCAAVGLSVSLSIEISCRHYSAILMSRVPTTHQQKNGTAVWSYIYVVGGAVLLAGLIAIVLAVTASDQQSSEDSPAIPGVPGEWQNRNI